MLNIYKFLFIILFLPQFLLSQDIPTTPIKLLAKESQQQAIAKPTEQTNTDDLTQNIEDQIDSENKLVDDVINNINNESYLTTLPEKNYYDNEILFLTNRIKFIVILFFFFCSFKLSIKANNYFIYVTILF